MTGTDTILKSQTLKRLFYKFQNSMSVLKLTEAWLCAPLSDFFLSDLHSKQLGLTLSEDYKHPEYYQF